MSDSPFLTIKRLEAQVTSVLSALDVFAMQAGERKLIVRLKNELVDARLDVRDYELSETRTEQVSKAKDARKRLEQIRSDILAVSEYNVFSAVDVAQLTAELEAIMNNLV